MAQVELVPSSIGEDWASLAELNVVYARWVFDEAKRISGISFADIVGHAAEEYAMSAMTSVCGHSPPSGIFYLAMYDGRLAGMGGLRPLSRGIAELKRVFVRDAFRGRGIGGRLLTQLLSDAAQFGYERVRLDTALFMRDAHEMYQSAGFTDIPPYPEAEVPDALQPHWRFMERGLA